MKNISSMQRTVIKLEDLLLPKTEPDKGPTVDYELFTVKEQDIADTIHLFHDIAVRLGHGELRACRYHIPIENDPNCREEAWREALENATPEELKRIELQDEIWAKWIRLTSLVTEEEKDIIKQYNAMVRDDKFSKPPFSGSHKPPNPEKLKEARLFYEQIMAKYGATSYEDNSMKSYVAGSGIPLDVLRKMDPTAAAHKEMIGAYLK